MIKLILPPTIRLAQESELPKDEAILERLRAIENNKIVEGYKILKNTNSAYSYKFFAEINIDNSSLWNLFRKLMMSMPDEISLITASKEDKEPVWNNYEDKYSVYNLLERYSEQLVQDGFIEFGVIHQDEDYFEEVYVKSFKYIQYWGMDINKFTEILLNFSIYETKDIEFIDEYPVTTQKLHLHNSAMLESNTLLRKLRTNNKYINTDDEQ